MKYVSLYLNNQNICVINEMQKTHIHKNKPIFSMNSKFK